MSQEPERLQKYMAAAGVASRRKCEELITSGRVKVNGQVVTELGCKVNPVTDKVEVDGNALAAGDRKIYILLNKPAGILSSATDDRGRKTVVDLIKGVDERLYPVGRLDFDTEGLLLLTNDGTLTNGLIHPRYKVDKTYHAVVKGIPDKGALLRLAKGIELDDGPTHPAKVKVLQANNGKALVEITIHEGRKRQVRRMFDAVGYPVVNLKRVQVGFLTLERLKPGEYRHLSQQELKRLYNLVGIPLM